MLVRFADSAEDDLESLGDFIAQDEPERALSFVPELRVACLARADFPERFPLVPRYEDRGVRRHGQGDYPIVYRAEANQVVILHIRRGTADHATRLFPS
ncbi:MULTISPECIES: type II toxin-antitoxin system RelE/ParE family toxin [unclassified Methylobacterium]|jgi:toxin ParE1/3/4|uniref:type II toxin-antitoxin system RelE/ParE family toxin n=1 Tax=unclassified Methylobacterium TaxID=2615210 RepID=UPI001355367B|nr:type II toxin-antitoxin system RelE/ParE family toxin [Methylobacterium sp. 2A]MWV23767.1 type II toxin-antitoxin system RelE/ParE family toxin [Methylobacterium sp. 2A]